MKKRPLGTTGVEVSVLGFGCAPLGDLYGNITEQEGVATLNAAIDAGINLVDVAPYYGLTLAEERLGKALKGRRDEVFLATKCCRFGHRGFDFSAARVQSDVDDSLKRLQTDHLDLFQVHDVEFGSRQQILEETLPAIEQIKKSGKARFVGITGLPVQMLRDLISEFPVDTVLSYCHYNLMVDDLETVLVPTAQAQGVGIINASPLHMGILSSSGPQPWHPASTETIRIGQEVARLCQQHGASVSSVALRFALDNSNIASTLCGMKSPQEVQQNVAVLDLPIDPELLDQIAQLVAPVRNETWHEGLPENSPPGL
ncbi:MAG: aldo/keto reductase [Planctomycetota bacterium]|nr:aldo/keto reductase [Planctomycetota bacterium]